jgi:molybdopterin/thiamine biosynthesis adenylyltransferase/rhodanese-related sulfurtransferase
MTDLNTLTPDELVRYSRHLRLGEVGQNGQLKLKRSRVLVIGMGGLGSPAALYLAAAGVGRIGLADFDRVESHNLQRQIIHDSESIGTAKLESAHYRLHALNPHIQIDMHPEGVTCANALALFSDYDVIVDGSDNFPTRYLVNDAAYLAGKPLVYGSVFQFEGQVTLFDASSGGPCYRCLFPEMPPPGTVPNCDQAGVIGALCGMVGSAQAMEAIKVIMGIGTTLRGKLMVIDALDGRTRTISIKRDPDCPLCGREPAIIRLDTARYAWTCETAPVEESPAIDISAPPEEVSLETAHAWLKASQAPLLVDVRESFEVEICQLPESRHLPLGQLPLAYSALPKDRPLLVYCHHGMRSLKAVHFLRSKGFTLTSSLQQGIDGWAQRYDRSMRRY